MVNVLVTVRDKQGQLVRGLTKDDFTLEEDGRNQTIRYFSPQSGLPLTLGLLVDVSGSQRTVLAEQRRASQQFLDQVLRNPQDQAFLVRFDRQIALIKILLFAGAQVQKKTVTRRETRPVERQCMTRSFSLPASSPVQPGRKALVVLSDGYDTSSAATISSAIETAQRADALVYSIRFLDRDIFAFQVPASQGGSPVPREGRKALERIAKETGGTYFDLTPAESLQKIYSRIDDELRNQYSLGFTPVASREKRPSGYRKIHVSVKQKGLTVQARDGYYPAPSEQ